MSRLTDPVHLTLKAATAAAAGALLANLTHVPDALSSSFVALVCVTPSAYAGLRRGMEQLGGAVIAGAITAAMFAIWPYAHNDPHVAVVVFASVAVTTGACLRLRWAGGHITAGFTTLYLSLLPFPNFSTAMRVRLLAVLLGIAAATLVNVAVSFTSGRRILARRLRIARAAVAEPLRETALACAEGASREGLAARYGSAFATVSELHRDLAGLAREIALPSRHAVRREARDAIATAARLEEVSHLGKHLALLLEDSDAHEPQLRRALDEAVSLVATGEGDPRRIEEAAAGVHDAPLHAALRRLSRALRVVGERSSEP